MKRLVVALSLVAVLAVSATALASVTLAGKYTTKVRSGQLAGTWTLNFKRGSVIVRLNGGLIATNAFSISGNTVTFPPGGTCHRTGTYQIKLTGAKLKLTRIKDACVNRSTVLSYSYTKAK